MIHVECSESIRSILSEFSASNLPPTLMPALVIPTRLRMWKFEEARHNQDATQGDGHIQDGLIRDPLVVKQTSNMRIFKST